MPKLVEGLRLLNQADPCVETFQQSTGEHVILTAGELHLERCLKDLQERFAKIKIQASPAIVPFRETIVAGQDMPPPKLAADQPRGTALINLLDGKAKIRIRARPLPIEIADFLALQVESIRTSVLERTSAEAGDALMTGDVQATRLLSREQLWEEILKVSSKSGSDWPSMLERVKCFGPRRCGANVLVDLTQDASQSLKNKKPNKKSANEDNTAEHDPIVALKRSLRDSLDTAFQLATLRGPLCSEPMFGLAFCIESIELSDSDRDRDTMHTWASQLTGATISQGQEAFRNAFLDWSPRLLLAMYSCDIQASTDVLGKVYGVVARRRGRIIAEEMKEGTTFFLIKTRLPIIDSFGFAEEIRKRTSGAASPQLVFHGFELLDQDPFWVPTTEEELEDLGDIADRENIARKYMDQVRKRKGLAVSTKIVESAEKQRTLKK